VRDSDVFLYHGESGHPAWDDYTVCYVKVWEDTEGMTA
jgi:hypothetical protein